MQWDEFISRFDMSVFSNLMKELNDESDQRFEDHVKRRKREGYVHELYDFDSYVFKLYDTVVSNGRRLIRYVKKNRSRDNFEEVLLGYFQPFQKGWVFVFMDSSHLWKNIRERATFVMPDWDARVIGSSMIFCNFSQLESDTRYHFLNGEIVDEDRFVFKTGCVRINDVYIGSAKTNDSF